MSRQARIRSLHLSNFRNYEALNWELAPGFTIVTGENAQGKTNFLESVFWLSTTKLLRGHRDQDAIKTGAGLTSVRIELIDGMILAGTLPRGGKKQFSVHGSTLPRASDILGRLPSVSISISDLNLVRGEPGERRQFLDLELSSLYPAYFRHLAVYKRALEQRNALLRAAQDAYVDPSAFEPWETPMAIHGAAIRDIRNRFVRELSPVAADFHRQLAGKPESLLLTYEPKDPGLSDSELQSLYEAERRVDIQRGTTRIGPHRDELVITIDQREAKPFGSQGQQRTAVIALKLSTLTCATAHFGIPPVLLLDDMLSDLDPVRRAALCELVGQLAGQAILTCTDIAAAGPTILSQADVLVVQNGTVQRGSVETGPGP